MSRYTHEQTEPALTWEVRHNLSTRAPIVDTWVVIEGQKQKILPKAVRATDLNVCYIDWSTPRAGVAGVV